MSLSLELHTAPEVPLEAASITPHNLSGLNEASIANIKVHHGNQQASIGDFFRVQGTANGCIHLEGDLSRIKHLGAGMSSGQIHVHGNAGAHLGADMSGGEIIVDGNAEDWIGPEMTGGRIIIKGNAGHLAGSAYRGSASGMQGGEIFIHGNVKNETGHTMRNGLIAVGGNSGDFTGVNMQAGTIIIMGEPGIRTGAGMKRGTIITMHDAELLPTFSYSCLYHPAFIRILLHYVKSVGIPVNDDQIQGKYHRWCGDSIEQNRGEILIFKK
jgi:formylmethanofuran dehydrogenase subunit C